MEVNTLKLWEAVKNVSVFSTAKGPAGGLTGVNHSADGYLTFTTTDGFVAIQSRVMVGTEFRIRDHYIPHRVLKNHEKILRDLNDDTISVDDFLAGESLQEPIEASRQFWSDLLELLGDKHHYNPIPFWEFALSPERLSKFNLLEPKGEYFLSLGSVSAGVPDGEFLEFQYGPDTTGLITPLDSDKLKEIYGDEYERITL